MTGHLWEDESQPEAKRTAKPKPPGRPPLTDALKAILAAGGYMDAETGAFRKAQFTRCPTCHRQVWRGLNADRMAWAVDAESGPLTASGEAMARLGGWTTVTLRKLANYYLLDMRDQFVIRGEPAGSQVNCDVLVVHRCGIDSTGVERGPSRMPVYRAVQPLPIDPPF